MAYKEKILKIISDEKEKIMNSEDVQKYNKMFEISYKIMEVFDDFTKIKNITEEDLTYIDEEAAEIIRGVKFLCKTNTSQNEKSRNEIISNLYTLLKLNVKNKVFKDKNFDALDKRYTIYLDEEQLLNSDLEENHDKIIQIIEKYHQEGKITTREAIDFNIEIGELIAQKYRTNNKNEERTTIDINEIKKEIEEIEETTTLEEITNNEETVKELFKECGYSFETLHKTTKELILKYVDLEYAKYILRKLFEYKVSNTILQEYQIAVFQIFICKEEKETFDKVLKFVDNNECSLAELLRFGGIFHEKSKKIILKGMQENPAVTSKQKNPLSIYLKIKRNYQDFMKNIELYKKCEGKEKITNDILKKVKQIGLCTPHERFEANLRILRRYEIIGQDEFPKSFTALSGIYSEYQIDRFIECGLLNYIKKNTSYIAKTAHPFKFYKIRRAQDLGLSIFSTKGLKAVYNDDPTLKREKVHGEKSESVNGIYYQHQDEANNKPARIIQENYTDEQYQKQYIRPVSSQSFDQTAHYRYAYQFQECNPEYIFSRKRFNPTTNTEISKNLTQIFDLAKELKHEVKDKDYEQAEKLTQIKIFDEGICQTIDGEFPIKVNNETYEFRAYRYPDTAMIISRQKVIKLFSLLDTYTIDGKKIWELDKNPNTRKDTFINIILSVMTNDSILSNWEINYLRNIIQSNLNNYLNSERRKSK